MRGRCTPTPKKLNTTTSPNASILPRRLQEHVACHILPLFFSSFVYSPHQRRRLGFLELGRHVQRGGGDRLGQRRGARGRARVPVEVVESHGHSVPAVPQEGRHLVLVLEIHERGKEKQGEGDDGINRRNTYGHR